VALELLMIGAYGSLNPGDSSYLDWKQGASEVGYTRCRRRLSGTLTKGQAKWMFEDGQFLAALYHALQLHPFASRFERRFAVGKQRTRLPRRSN
jgi:hypothetical protein